MKTIIHYVGIDVDDKGFQVHIDRGENKEGLVFRTKPNVGSLTRKLESKKETGSDYKICYEASYLGYSLQRELSKKGYECEIIAPSLIPQERGKRIKTDRIDSKKLAEYYRKGLLTVVSVPDEEEEKIRDLIRSRKFIKEQEKKIKFHILSLCRRYNISYRAEVGKKRAGYWTETHLLWLRRKVKRLEKESALKTNFLLLLSHKEILEQQVKMYDEQIKEISEREKYKEKVKALICYRGISILSAMTIIMEIGDIKRFEHPRKLMSYAGFDLREYSSGGKERKYGISKMGNKYIRTSAVESCQRSYSVAKIGKDLKKRRKEVEPKLIKIADKCMVRLYKKSTRLLLRGKEKNKIKIACARELLGFIWESLREVS